MMPAPVSESGLVTTRRPVPALRLRGEAFGRMLGPREATILARLANGHDRDRICRDLTIAPSTMRSTLWRAYRKLGVSDELSAVLALGWLKPPDIDGEPTWALSETWTAA